MQETNALIYLLAVAAAAVFAFSLVPFAYTLAFKIGAVDVPLDDRRMHSRPIPRSGGLAIAAAIALGILTFTEITPAMLFAIAGAFIILLAGISDDINAITPIHKLLLQFLAAAVAYFGGFRITDLSSFGFSLPLGVFSLPITMLFILTLINSHNFLDGLDGLAGSVSAIEAFFLALFSLVLANQNLTLAALLLLGATLGFLFYNISPAKIFMGDTGSMLLGYILSLLGIKILFSEGGGGVFSALIIFALPLTDITFVTLKRILSGKNPFCADKGHLHHVLTRSGFSQRAVWFILASVSAFFPLALVGASLFPAATALIIIFLAIAVTRYVYNKNQSARQNGVYRIKKR